MFRFLQTVIAGTLFFFFLFSPPPLYAQTAVEFFRDGAPDRGIQAIQAMPDSAMRSGVIALALDALPSAVPLTATQITDMMTLSGKPLSPAEENIMIDRLKRIMVTMKDHEMLDRFIKGAGAYGGQTEAGKQLASNFFARAGLMEMQVPFIADWKTLIVNHQQNALPGVLEFHVRRATASGRQADARVVWEIITAILGTQTPWATSIQPRCEELLLTFLPLLSDKETEPFLQRYLSKPEILARLFNKQLNTVAIAMNVPVQPASAGEKRFPWLPAYQILTRFANIAAGLNNNVTVWPLATRQQQLIRAGQLWNEVVRKIVAANDDKVRRLKLPYNREPLQQEILTAEHAEELLAVSPNDAFMKKLVEFGMLQSFDESKINLLILSENFDGAVDMIAAAQKMGRSMDQLTFQMNTLFDKMALALNPNYVVDKQQYNIPVKAAISMTRLKQNANLAKFRSVLSKLRTIGLSPSPEKLLIVFEAIHSKAEIYNYQDIILTFGKPAEMSEQILFKLGMHMRTKLAKEWSADNTQLDMVTNRTPVETQELVIQGYNVLDSILSEAQSGMAGRQYLIHALRGITLYQYADYLEQRNAPDIVSQEKRSFGLQCFQRAAQQYNAWVPDLYESQYSTTLYEFWFDAFMLAGAGKYNVKDRPNIFAIRAEINKMSPDAAHKHLEMLSGKLMIKLAQQTPASRPIYLESALKVIDGTRIAATFKRRLDYYRSLVNEAQLIVEAETQNGNASKNMIGLRIYLRHTPELSRESGGFTRYLAYGSNPNAYIMNAMTGMSTDQPSIANRENLEKRFTESLNPAFDILSLAFCDQKTEPILQSDGWMKLPLAYALVSPKQDTLDCIPPVAMDLEFADDNQLVVLPVESAPVSVRLTAPDLQPVPHGVTVTQRANFRDLSKGRAQIEITAKASGIIGPFETLFEKPIWRGFSVSDQEDGGIQVNEVLTDSQHMSVNFERTWIFHLKPDTLSKVPLTLLLAVPKPGVTVRNLYTHDVNFTECGETCPVRTPEGLAETFASSTFLGYSLLNFLWTILGGLIAVAALILTWRVFRCRPGTNAPVLHIPENDGPFAMLRFLKELEHSGLITDTEEKVILCNDIAVLEKAWFSPDSDPAAHHNLILEIATRYLPRKR